MTAFPARTSVGDLLAAGAHIDLAQERLLDAPDGQPMLTVWGLPDPASLHEHGAPWCIDGLPVVVPMILNNCLPSEKMGAGWAPWLGEEPTLLDAVGGPNEPFAVPTVVAERGDAEDLIYHRANEVADGHFASPTWDLWPVEDSEAAAFNAATWQAIEDSGYLQLVDYFGWLNGYDEPENEEQVIDVESIVLACNGELRDADSFKVQLHLPSDRRYIWDRLIDLSQQGWQSYGMSLPEKERKRFFYPNGETPWF